MIRKYIRIIIIILISVGMAETNHGILSAAPQSKTAKKKKTSATAKKTQQVSSKKSAPAPKTSAEAKKRREEAQKEIRLTEQQIRENDLEVSKNLKELGLLEGDISETKNKIAGLNNKLNSLSKEINHLESSIENNENDLTKLRQEYLKAVKKMRLTKKNKSALAFIFSSENFNQAFRRMRYLREFSSWKEKQTDEINSKISELKREKESLAKAREEQRDALDLQKASQSKLLAQHKRQEEVVADLKKNGAALQSHLQRKQAEADELGGTISRLIAAEEQQRIAEEKARAEEARRIEEERKRQEELLAAREKELAETNSESPKEELAMASSSKEKKKTSKGKKEKVVAGNQDNKKSKQKDNNTSVTPIAGEKPKQFADARKRNPRSGSKTETTSSVSNSSDNFADMRGYLPNPTNGSFRVTSRFGKQSLPDLPDVVYDNPGIDAESSPGASALAVFKGKVSGVYLLPGYNTVVIVNHGGYYTVYGNIASPSVKVGDSVEAGQGLGALALNDEDSSHSSLHFEVWKNREKLNPLEWLR